MPLAQTVRAVRSFLAALAVAIAAPAMGQGLPVVLGEPVVEVAAKSAAVPGLLTTEEEFPARRLRLAAPLARELRALDEDTGPGKRVMLGFGRPVADYAVEGAGGELIWSRVGEWRIAKLRVQSPGARAIRVGLRMGSTAQPWNLRVAGSDDESKALGPVRLAGPLGQSDLYWTPLTEGDAQVIEITSPAGLPEPAVEVASVSHLVLRSRPADAAARTRRVPRSRSVGSWHRAHGPAGS